MLPCFVLDRRPFGSAQLCKAMPLAAKRGEMTGKRGQGGAAAGGSAAKKSRGGSGKLTAAALSKGGGGEVVAWSAPTIPNKASWIIGKQLGEIPADKSRSPRGDIDCLKI